MQKKYAFLGIASILLTVASTLYIVSSLKLYQGYQRKYPDWTSATGPCGALVTWSPPTVLYTGLYVNQNSLLTLRYRSPQPQTLRISVSIPQFTQAQNIQVQATPVFRSQTFKPPLLGESALESLVAPGQRMSELRLQIENSDGVVCDTSANILLKSPEYMLWYDSALNTDNTPYLAGWVTPTAPAIQKLVGLANLQIENNPSWYPGLSELFGYGDDGDAATQMQVREEVDAIFDTLQFDYRLTYASDNIPFEQDNAQRIKLPSDILNSPDPSGMCVETTAIMASAVEYLGMRPYFIIVPGHAFLGVALGQSSSAPHSYWETSDLNGPSNGGRSTGEQANIFGNSEYAKDKGEILEIVDVQYERDQGIMPIE
ncbi:MAG: hypothetical protein ACLQUY_02790 [Ktedonobacterales bacterium]